MNTPKITYNTIFRIGVLVGVCIFSYYFPDILLYLFLAFILMLIGNPLASAISKVKIGKRHIPRSISAALTILVFISVLLLSVLFFVPSLVKELRVLENIDYENLMVNLNVYLNEFQQFLYHKGFIPVDQTLVGIVVDHIKNWIDLTSIPSILGNVVNSTGTFFFGLFAVFFIAFFFIKDDMHIENLIKFFFNKKYVTRLTLVVENINHLLSRYFVGLLVKTGIMTLLLYIGFLLFGIKGALLMALIGGITNIIPYLGPFIGWGIVCIFGLTNGIGTGMYADILPMLIKISITFISANVVDNVVLGPVIYSQSIKAHPVEVFLVTILGGRIGGMAGMVLGIPVYTILRIIVKEIYHYVSGKDGRETGEVKVDPHSGLKKI